MKNLKRALSIVLCLTVIFNLVGCMPNFKKKNKEQEAQEEQAKSEEIMAYEEAIEELQNELSSVKKEIALYDPKYQTTGSFKKNEIIVAGAKPYNKINDKIVLEGKLLEDYENISNTSKVNLTNNITITPNKTWNISLSTAETIFSQQGAYGTIEVKEYFGDLYYQAMVTEAIEPFLKKNKLSVQSKRDIFVGDNKYGEEARARIVVYDSTTPGNTYKVKFGDLMDKGQCEKYNATEDQEVDVVIQAKDKTIDATLRIGAIKIDDTLIEYKFITEDSTSDTLLDNLISSIKVGKQEVHLQ